ncbi:uncharacterized protein [Nicotiana sylvestris]|uniref:uncharacterized protein n=1 Tax=Nicotiana sylvestris TaxID=4096 RepID=UPI00388C9638
MRDGVNLRWVSLSRGESRQLGNVLVQNALDKVKLILEQLRTAQSRQKSYADKKVCDVSYMVGEKVLLEVSPMKGIMRFGKKGKLALGSLGHLGCFRGLKVAYKIALPPSLSSVHPVFHVSMLRKYVGDPSHVLNFSTIQLNGDMTYDVEPVTILDRQVRKLRSKDIASIKVQWRGHPIEEATWEIEREMWSI